MDADGSNKTLLTDHVYPDVSPAWSPDGQTVAFLSYRDRQYDLYVMDADGGGKRRIAQDLGYANNAPAWSPDGRHIAYSQFYSWKSNERNPNFEIFVVEPNDHNKIRLTHAKGSDHSPVWSPDGARIAFGSDRSGTDDSWEPDSDIYIMDANGQNEKRLTNRYGNEVYLRWSPQSDRIVFEDQDGSGSEIYIIDVP